MHALLQTLPLPAVLFIRIAVGGIFLSEGIQKLLVAISTTKLAQLPAAGFWETAHGTRTNFAMLLCNLFLLAAGGGRWSADSSLFNRKTI